MNLLRHAALAVFMMSLTPGLISLTTSVAQAASPDELVRTGKAQGLVGERADGYLGLVKSDAPADIKAAVQDINAKRKAAYQNLARQQNVTVEQVAALTGEKLIARAPAGEYVMHSGGQWSKK